MKRNVFIGTLIILLVNVLSYSVGASTSDSVIIRLESSDPGDHLTVADVNWPTDFDQQIELVNQGQGKFCVEIYNDPTVWEMVKHLKKNKAVLDSGQMNLTMDGGLNVARFQNVIRLMKAKGLKRLDLSYAPDRDDSSYIMIYYLPYLQGDSHTGKRSVSRTDTVLIFSSFAAIDEARWSLSLGGELTPVSDGRPIVVPTASLTMSKGNCELGLVGGYWPGEFDEKFFAGYLTWFPGGGNIGWRNQLIYASRTIETLGAYVQQGYGPMTGLEYQSGKLSLYLSFGGQYFDRQRQDRRLKPSVNLGLSIKTINF